MTTAILALGAGLALTWLGAEVVVRGAVGLGRAAGISPMIVGLTIVSMGTSMPELIVCVVAALQGSPDLAIGNVLGSNMANVGLILGLGALIHPMRMRPTVTTRDVPWMLGMTLLLLPLIWNLQLGRFEGAILAVVFACYIVVLIRAARRAGASPHPDAETSSTASPRHPAGAEAIGVADADAETTDAESAGAGPPRRSRAAAIGRSIGLIAVGCIVLVFAARWIVDGATFIAIEMGVSELVLGLSIVAVGTSLSELATTIVAALRRQTDLAVGNLVGSSIFNIAFVLGATALVRPIAVPERILSVEFPATLLICTLLLPFALTAKRLGRREGFVLVAAYVGAWFWILSA